MMGVCLRGNGGNKLGHITEGGRNVSLAQAVVTGPTVERGVHGAKAILPRCKKLERLEMSAVKCPATWWLPTRCSQGCSMRSGPSIRSLQRSSPRNRRWQGRRWQSAKRSQPRQRRSVRSLCKPFVRPPTKAQPLEGTMRKHNKKLEAANKALEDLQAKTADLEDERKETYVDLVRAQEGVADTRMSTPTWKWGGPG